MRTMRTLAALAVAATLAFSGATFAQDDSDNISALDALSSAGNVSFQTWSGGPVPNADLVDLDSLKARIKQNPQLLAQLEAYGATLDDVIGIGATDETDVTIYVTS